MEDFVTFEKANKLKEKGFPQVEKNSLAMYNEVGEWFSLAKTLDKDEYSFEDFDDRDCVCPTIAQVLKWLRKEKRIDAGAIWSNNDKVWVGYVNEMDMQDLVSDYVLPNNSYNSYEDAVMSAIEYILDNNLI